MISSLQHHQPKTPSAHKPAMKELLCQLAAYNVWASQKLLDFINALPEEKQNAEVLSSFKSLYGTILHMWDAESIWWQRMKMHERIIRPSENFKGSMKDVSNGLLSQSKLWKDWVNNANEMMLDHVVQYYNTKRELFKDPTWQMLLHVFNHGSYHRGQLVNILRQLAVEKIPPTDFILFARKK